MAELIYKEDSYIVQGAFYTVYKTFRNSQKEKVYHNSLMIELRNKKVIAEKNKRLEVLYEGCSVGLYFPDIVVNDKIIIEIKCKPFLHRDDKSQFWNYLKNSKFKVGYLVNFGKPDGVEFIRRVYDKARKV